jgi:hypothetical protein
METAMSDDSAANLVANDQPGEPSGECRTATEVVRRPRQATGGAAAGHALARRANRPRIEQEIRARYAAELAGADICDSLRIEARIRAEIERALAVQAPAGALY